MKSPIKVGIVNYLNAKPLNYGIQHHPIAQEIIISEAFPAAVADDLISNKINIGLVPVATLMQIPNAHIVGHYGIAADGIVASVCIYSQVPMESIEIVYLDYQSKTSIRLAQILMKHHFKHAVQFKKAPLDFIDKIGGNTAAVIIGDRALAQLQHFEYVYDLADEWKKFTGLPFVFAAWISTVPLSADFIAAFDEANAYGLGYIDEIVANTPFEAYDLKKYYTENIHYYLDASKIEGLKKYLHYLTIMQKELI